MPFGKYKGRPIQQVLYDDRGYKLWLIKSIDVVRYPELYNVLHNLECEYLNKKDGVLEEKVYDKILLIDGIQPILKNGMSEGWKQDKKCIRCDREKYNPQYYFLKYWNICKLCSTIKPD